MVGIALLLLLCVAAVAMVKLRNLLAVVMMAGIYSLLSAAVFVVLDAVDVAFTEAAVGAGISTVLFLGTLSLVGYESKKRYHHWVLPTVVVVITGVILAYGTLDMPPFGDPANPIHHHVAPRYLEESGHEIGVPNVVTSVLASYRGYDTMGEAAVIFTAMVGVILLITSRPRRPWPGQRPEEEAPERAAEAGADGEREDGVEGGDAHG